MNTQGYLRGYMAHNMKTEQFIKHIVKCLGKEFDVNSNVIKVMSKYVISFDNYKLQIDETIANELQIKDPYALDREILENLKKQGFIFELNRSQYMTYIWNILEAYNC